MSPSNFQKRVINITCAITRHERRHSGRTYPDSTINDTKQNIINNCLDPQPFWDDWNDRRDGFRGYDDRTRIHKKSLCWYDWWNCARWNKKNKKLLLRRKAMKLK